MKTGMQQTEGRLWPDATPARGMVVASAIGSLRKAVLVALLCTVALLLFTFSGAGQAEAAAPQILNSTQWLESTSAATNGGAAGTRDVTLTLMVKHDVGRRINRIKIDDDYDGTDNTTSKSARTLSTTQWEQPTIVGGYGYTRVTYTYNAPAGGTLNCPFLGEGDRTGNRSIRVRALDDSGQESGTANGTIRFVRYDCNAREDYPVIYQRGQNKTSITPGETVTFTFTGDDSDSGVTGNRDFGGINYRFRRVHDGETTGSTRACFGNSDNTQRSFNHTFTRRGHWIVEAELLNNGDCNTNPNSGGWWRIGSVDVNSPAADGPNVTLTSPLAGVPARPQIGQSFTVTANVDDTADSGNGGVAQDIEWDLDGNNVYDEAGLGDWKTGLTTAMRQRTISTAGKAPGLYTVRARVGDNGAIGGADDIRRTKVGTMQYRVDAPPVALPDSHRTVTDDDLNFALAGTDSDGDPLTYSVITPPEHGTVTGGTAAARTYTPAAGFAGTDSLEFRVDDGYGGTATATVEITVDPDLRPFDGPTGTADSRGGEIEFDSSATGASFECQLDDGPWENCISPFRVTDLPDGEHTLRTRVTANGLTNQDVGQASWTVDAYPEVEVGDVPDPVTDTTGAAVDFTLSEVGATVTPTAECRLDGLEWAPCESPAAYEDLDDGEHTIRIRATDAFGKQTTEQVQWTVLTDGGSTAIEEPRPSAFTRDTSAEVHFSVDGPSDRTECSLDGGSWEICTSPATFTGLAEGRHSVRVRSANELGNSDDRPSRVSWTVDRTPPAVTITSGPEGPTVNGPASFTFESNESFSTFECKLDAGDYEPCGSPFDLPEGIADGDHSFRVAAIDRAGNRSPAPQRDFRLLTAVMAPGFTSGPAQGETTRDTAASFGFATAQPVTGFECRLDENDWAPCATPAAVTGLADGPHTFAVRSIDEVGNRSSDPVVRSWTVDSTPPSTTITEGPSGRSASADASFRFSSSEAGSSFECSLDDEPFDACASPVELTGLDDGAHEFRVRAIDTAGNSDSSPATRAWTVDTSTPAPPDPALPDPEGQPCDFSLQQERCGDPYLIASARAAYRKPRGKGNVKVDLASGGTALRRILAKTPPGLHTRAIPGKAGRKVGKLILTGSSRLAVPLKLPRKAKKVNVVAKTAAGLRVTLKPRALVATGLPPGVTGAKVRLKSSRGLGVSATVCGTRNWRAVLTDVGSISRHVNAKGDTNCVRKGNR